ncbi:MAG: hypothetical protein RLZZ338_605 [Cyanobacteriota bacterium]|jgi:tetratricopeptide (TPR) repeat protein
MNPETTVMELNQAQQLFTEGNLEGAIAVYRRVIENDPQNKTAYYGLGESFAKLGQLEDAIGAYRQAIQLIQQEKQKAPTLEPTGDREEAIKRYRHRIEDNPDNLSQYYKLLELEPDNQEVLLQLAQALVRQEQIEDAIVVYRRLVELSPCEEYYQQLGELLVKQEKWDDAIIVYKRAIEFNPESYLYYYQLGEVIYNRVVQNPESFFVDYKIAELPHKDYQVFDSELPEVCFLKDQAFLQATSHLDDATYVVEVYRVYLRRMLSDAEKQGAINWQQTPGHSREMGLKHWREGLEEFQSLFKSSVLFQCLQESINCYRRAIELNQHHYQSHYRLGDVLSVGKINEAITVYHHLALLLAEQGLINEAVDCFERITHIQHRSENIYDLIWRQLNQLIPMPQTNSYYPKEFAQGKVAEYFHKTSQYREMNLDCLTDADKKFLEVAGLSMANLELIREDSQDLEEIYINSFNAGNPNTILANKKSKAQNYKFVFQPILNKPNYYQQSIVETGYIYAACPVTGKILRSNQSFYDVAWLPMISYRFVGSEIFYLVVGHFFGAKMFVYFPRLELVVKFGHFVDSKDIINRLKSNMVNHWEGVKNYMDKPKKEPVAILGSISVIGHYLWNELTGLYYLCENEILEKLTNILVEPHEYYNVGDIFPEVRDKIIRLPDKYSVFQAILSSNYCAVRVTNVFIKEKLATRIYESCVKRCSAAFLQEVEQAKKHFPILCFGIRTHNKFWVSQVEGIANIIKTLHSDFPDLAVIFEGWSRTEREEYREKSLIEENKAVLDRILELIPPNISTYTTIGSMTYEKVALASVIDMYVIPLSSGNTAVSWIANKPGVVHSSTVIGHAAHREQFAQSRENAAQPVVFIPSEHIVDQDAPPYIISVHCQNYDCDWRIIYNEALKIINSLNENRA